jgi:cullin 3
MLHMRPPTIANRRKGLGQQDVDFDTTWAILEKAFFEIHTKNASALSFEELYRNAYKIVLKKRGEELYNKVAHFEAQWLGGQVRSTILKPVQGPLLLFANGMDQSAADATAGQRRSAGESFLRALKESWEDHQVCMGMLTDVLMYMVSCSKLDVVGAL